MFIPLKNLEKDKKLYFVYVYYSNQPDQVRQRYVYIAPLFLFEIRDPRSGMTKNIQIWDKHTGFAALHLVGSH
jgi:hypothetical protein